MVEEHQVLTPPLPQRSAFAGKLQTKAALISPAAYLMHAKVEVVDVSQVSCPPVHLHS